MHRGGASPPEYLTDLDLFPATFGLRLVIFLEFIVSLPFLVRRVVVLLGPRTGAPGFGGAVFASEILHARLFPRALLRGCEGRVVLAPTLPFTRFFLTWVQDALMTAAVWAASTAEGSQSHVGANGCCPTPPPPGSRRTRRLCITRGIQGGCYVLVPGCHPI